MSEERIPDFESFWVYYLNEHVRSATRWFHFVGMNISLGVLIYAVVTMNLWLVPVAVLSGYAMAWASYFLIEKNRPATFKYPGWSFNADIRLWQLM